VAQPGSAPVLGTGGRKFESSRPDHFKNQPYIVFLICFMQVRTLYLCAVGIASVAIMDRRAKNAPLILCAKYFFIPHADLLSIPKGVCGSLWISQVMDERSLLNLRIY
jgi:hypothetical protein